MDPDTCAGLIAAHALLGETTELRESLLHLAEWLENGGAYPSREVLALALRKLEQRITYFR